MTEGGQPRKPRHRRRATASAGPPPPPAPEKITPPKSAKSGNTKRRNDGERGLRDLAGTGASRVGVSRALRARDVNRPTEDDLAAAEAELQIVRRNWTPQS